MFYSLKSAVPRKIFEGYQARIHHGEHVTFAVVEVAPNASLPAHRHHNEQAGIVVQGEIALNVAGEKGVMRTGEGWIIPPNVEHDGCAGPEGAVIVEVWSPPREDFKALPELATTELPECLTP